MVLQLVIGMAISLLISLIYISHFVEKATTFSQLTAWFLVTFISFPLAKRVLEFCFPAEKLLLNLLLVFPFAIITYSFEFDW